MDHHLDGYATDTLTINGMSTVDGMLTASTTHSLVRQMNSVRVDLAIMQRAANQHNNSSTETIMSGATGQLKLIPFAGNDYNDKDISGTTKQIKLYVRWNTTKDMVERFLILKDAYNYVVAGNEELRDACYINQEELYYLEKLNEYLDIFHATTLFCVLKGKKACNQMDSISK